MARASQRSRTNQKPLYLLIFLILEMKNVHISCSKPPDRVPPCFDRTFLNISSTWIPNTLQNCKIHSFRKLMIKTSFQLFLLIKTIEKIAIFIENCRDVTFSNWLLTLMLPLISGYDNAPELKALQTNRIKCTILKVNFTNICLFLRIFQKNTSNKTFKNSAFHHFWGQRDAIP